MDSETHKSMQFLAQYLLDTENSNKYAVFRGHVSAVLLEAYRRDEFERLYNDKCDYCDVLQALLMQLTEHLTGKSSDRKFAKLEADLAAMREQVGPKLDALIKQKLAAERRVEELEGDIAELREGRTE